MRKLMTEMAFVSALFVNGSAGLAQTTPTPSAPSRPSTTPAPSETPGRTFDAAPYRGGSYSSDSRQGSANALLYPPVAQSRFYVVQYEQAEQSGRCAARLGGTYAADIFDAKPNSLPEYRRVNLLRSATRGCYYAGYGAPIPVFRGALAEALYLKQPYRNDVAALAPRPGEIEGFQQQETERRANSVLGDQEIASLTNCIAPRAPTAVRQFLLTKHGTSQERDALNVVFSAGRSCIAGTTTTVPEWGGTSLLRGYLAESAYRWSMYQSRT